MKTIFRWRVGGVSARTAMKQLGCLWLFGLVLLGCDFEARPKTTLHDAAEKGKVALVRTLISNGADVNALHSESGGGLTVYGEHSGTLRRNRTALMLASESGQIDVVRLLVESGANIYAVQSRADGGETLTAFDIAVRNRHWEIMKFLWKNSDKVQFRVRLAAHFVRACLEYCKLDATPIASENPALFLASVITDEPLGAAIAKLACLSPRPLETLGFLDVNGVRIPKNSLSWDDWTACPGASSAARPDVIAYLLAHGADVNAPDNPVSGSTPLMVAARNADAKIVSLLLSKGANPNATSGDGDTALDRVIASCSSGSSTQKLRADQRRKVELLLAAGAKRGSGRGSADLTMSLQRCCRAARQSQDADQLKMCELLAVNQ